MKRLYLFPRDRGLQRKVYQRVCQNKAEICEDELRLAEIQLSFSVKIISNFYCARQQFLSTLEDKTLWVNYQDFKIHYIFFKTFNMYLVYSWTLFILTGDIGLGTLVHSYSAKCYSYIHFIFISLPAQCDVNAPQGY